MTIAVTGSMAFDYIMTFPGSFTEHILPDQLNNLSVSFLVDSMRRERGGTAGNIAYSLALLGQPALLMATIGQDGREYVQQLTDCGVDTSGALILEDEFTASFFVSTDEHNRQIANFYPGAMGRSAEVTFKNQAYDKISVAVISPSSPDAMVQYVEECKALNIKYVYDPSQQLPRTDGETLRQCIDGASMLTVNDYEFELVKNKTNLSQDDITAMVEVLVVTRGEAGSTIFAEGETVHVSSATPTKVLDPTGGGDAYRGGLLAGWHHGLSWLEAGQLGALAATYAIEYFGTQQHSYTLEQ
ncbi:MAG: carbohydrate kinase family protein, partial [Chloroflexota bacterium]